MSGNQIGANTTGSQKDVIRVFNFQQTAADSATTNSSNPFPNTITIQFPYPQSYTGAEVALGSLYMFYSWYNISAQFGNNTFSYDYPNSAGTFTTFTVTIPDGFYSINDLNSFFQQAQINNGTYTISGGNNTTYLSFLANSTYYRVTFISTPVPPTGTTGVTYPSNYPGGSTGPPTSLNPSFIILPTGAGAGTNTRGYYSFSKTLGLSPGTYPTQGTNTDYNFNGQFIPVIESTNNVNVTCNMVNNSSINRLNQVFYDFSPSVAFGEQIVEKPFFPLFYPVADAVYQSITLTFYDENLVPLNLQDPHINGSLIFRGH